MHEAREAVRERRPPGRAKPGTATPTGRKTVPVALNESGVVDLQRRRDQLNARVAELQWDLGGLVYEMAIRDRIRVDVLVRRAACSRTPTPS